MDKKDEFKEFIKSKPELVDLVKNKKYTWQDFYEVYDLYGKDESVWEKYKENKDNIESDDRKNASITELTNLVKNINIISELTAKKPVDTISTVAKTPRVINKFFGD